MLKSFKCLEFWSKDEDDGVMYVCMRLISWV